MISSIALLVVTVLYGICLIKGQKRIKELENVVYYQMDGTHYPAIRNEFASVWRAIAELSPDEEEGEEDGE